jgi:predicted HAD superfamily Cof-like phosphohydrolase
MEKKPASNFEKIIEFHTSFGLPYNKDLSTIDLQNFKTASLRIKLIHEELMELYKATNIVEQLDAIGDLLYVVYGAGATFGINLDAEFDKVFKINLRNAIESSIFDTCYPGFPMRTFHSTPDIDTNFKKILYLYPRTRNILEHPTCIQPIYIITDNQIDFQNQLKELSHQILITDVYGVTNTLTKMLFTLYGVGYHCHYDIDKLYAEIHRSNMSKLCNSEQEAIDTVAMYKKNYAERYPNPAYRKANDDIHYIVFDQSTDKRLKSIYFSPPVIEPEKLTIQIPAM